MTPAVHVFFSDGTDISDKTHMSEDVTSNPRMFAEMEMVCVCHYTLHHFLKWLAYTLWWTFVNMNTAKLNYLLINQISQTTFSSGYWDSISMRVHCIHSVHVKYTMLCVFLQFLGRKSGTCSFSKRYP